MNEQAPLVTVVVPARDEEADIERCLAHVAAQDHPLDRLEVLVVDGGSSDATAARAKAALAELGCARAEVLHNPAGTTPSALNVGLAEADGEYVCRVDARSLVPPQYVRRCVELLDARPEFAVVGGAQIAIPPEPGPVGTGIARALNNRYAMGLSRYRRGASSGPSDTVYLGAFRTTDLRAEGGWDERFATNQDYELNRRMARRGLVWFESNIAVEYVPRRTLTDLARQYHRFGRWKAAGWLEVQGAVAARQIVALAAPPLLGALLAVGWRRRRSLAVVSLGTAAALLEGGARGPAPLPTRVGGLVALACVVLPWWAGAAGQGARFALGDRLIRSG